jgi:hypothetical protein
MRNSTPQSICRDRTVTHDRLGRQDKSRKVRPVGWFESACNFNLASNIANDRRNAPSLSSCCSCSAFDTLWHA